MEDYEEQITGWTHIRIKRSTKAEFDKIKKDIQLTIDDENKKRFIDPLRVTEDKVLQRLIKFWKK